MFLDNKTKQVEILETKLTCDDDGVVTGAIKIKLILDDEDRIALEFDERAFARDGAKLRYSSALHAEGLVLDIGLGLMATSRDLQSPQIEVRVSREFIPASASGAAEDRYETTYESWLSFVVKVPFFGSCGNYLEALARTRCATLHVLGTSNEEALRALKSRIDDGDPDDEINLAEFSRLYDPDGEVN